MSVKQYLKEYQKLNAEIDALVSESGRMRKMALSIGGSFGKGEGGIKTRRVGSARYESAIDKLATLEEYINDRIDKLVIKRTDIENVFDTIDNTTLRTVLRYRYIEGYTFERIAVNMNYSWRQVLRFHGQALSMVKDVM